MIHAKLGVCAESVVRDAETNAISVFNIFEDLKASSFPVAIPKLSALFILERDTDDPAQVDCLVTIRLGKKEIGRVTLGGDFEDKFRTRVILVAQGVVIDKPGNLVISCIVNNKTMGAWTIPVHSSEAADE